MNRANAERMRKSHEMVAALNNAGILFVPMPVIDDQDFSDLTVQADNRLEQIAEMAGEDNG